VNILQPVSAVPEPSTLISGTIGFVLALGYAWRRRSARGSDGRVGRELGSS
jgi:hypothetical protein